MSSLLASPAFRLGLLLVTGLCFGFAAAVLAAGDPQVVSRRARFRLRPSDRLLRRLERAGWPLKYTWFYQWARWPVGLVVAVGAANVLSPVPGMLLGVLVMLGPELWVRVRLSTLRRRVQAAVLESANIMVQLLGQHGTPMDAILLLGQSYSPPILQSMWRRMYSDIQRQGWAMAIVLARLDVDDGLFDVLATTLMLHSELGGELIEVLRPMVENMKQRDRLLRQIAATAIQQKVGAAMIPILAGGGLTLLQLVQGPQGYMAVYGSFPGAFVEMFAIGMFVVGYFATMWVNGAQPMTRLELVPDEVAG